MLKTVRIYPPCSFSALSPYTITPSHRRREFDIFTVIMYTVEHDRENEEGTEENTFVSP